MNYSYFRQEKNNFCVPACLQSILYRRDLEVLTQTEIVDFLKINEEGVILNQENLNSFLGQYDLKSRYIHPRTSFIEIDFVLEEALKKQEDILAAFYFDKENRHVTLLTGIKFNDVFLQDPDRKIDKIDLKKLIDSMPLDGQCGFYLIFKELF